MPRYRVVGNNEVLGREPGESFEADLDAVQEARLLAGGHIARVGRSKSPVVAHTGAGISPPPLPDDPGAPDDDPDPVGGAQEGSDT